MNLRKHHLIASALLAAALVIAAFAMSASAASPVKIANCPGVSRPKTLTRPTTLTLTCGDGNTVLKAMSWSSFGGASAVGKGTFITNTCNPNCASGKDVSYPAQVTATSPKKCKGGVSVYSKIALTFSGAKKPGPGVPRKWTFICPS